MPGAMEFADSCAIERTVYIGCVSNRQDNVLCGHDVHLAVENRRVIE